MKNLFKTFALTACLATASAWGADAGAVAAGSNMESFRAQLRAVEAQAREVSDLAKSKKNSAAQVRAEAEELKVSVQALRSFVMDNQSALGITTEKQKLYAETATQTMEIIVDNKLRLFDEGAYDKNRGVVRAKAKGIVERVRILEKAVLQPRG